MTLHEAATLLDDAGIAFMVYGPPFHGCHWTLTPDQVEEWAADEVAFFCRELGITRAEYDERVRTHDGRLCAAYTKKGEECRMPVKHGEKLCGMHVYARDRRAAKSI
jgi:hypothetical protein